MAGFPIYQQITAQNVLLQPNLIKFFGMAPDTRSKDSTYVTSKLPFRFKLMIQKDESLIELKKLLKLTATGGAILPRVYIEHSHEEINITNAI